MATPNLQSVEKALTLFSVVIADEGKNPLNTLAERAGVPFSTAHRLAATLERRGIIQRERPGRYVIGPVMLALARHLDEGRLIARLSRPALLKLARRLRQTVHLGVLEHGMVTYLTKESYGRATPFAEEGSQLEAYCSAIGKVLLAYMDDDQRERYLADGPFVPLTQNTIVERVQLHDHLKAVRVQGWAMDDGEMFDSLKCIAVPLRRWDGTVVAAVSVSCQSGLPEKTYVHALSVLMECVASIEAKWFVCIRRFGVAPSTPGLRHRSV